MIDSKYLDMLKKAPSVKERLDTFLSDSIDQLITAAICDFSDSPLPADSKYAKISMGTNKLSERELIIGDLKAGGSMCVEFSNDYKMAYVARSINDGEYEEVILSPESSEAAKLLFTSIHGRIMDMARKVFPKDPVKMAIEEFLSETRYGTNEYLCKEFLDIYHDVVNRQLSSIDNEEVVSTLEGGLRYLEVTDISQFLRDNGIDPDSADVHLI